MRRRGLLPVLALAGLATLAAVGALAIYEVSSAHGHGLAQTDRCAIQLLALLGVTSAAAAAALALRRIRARSRGSSRR